MTKRMTKRRLYFSTEQTITKKVSGYIDVDVEYAQVYKGLIQAFDKVNSVCALKLLPFLLFEMNKTNVVFFDSELIDKFNAQFTHPFHERTVRNAMAELAREGIVHRIQNGKYMVDANYCWVGNTTQRLDFIKNFEYWKQNSMIDIPKEDIEIKRIR